MALIAVLLGVGIWRSFPHAITIPTSRLVLDLPVGWQAVDAAQTFDDAWAADQKVKYPQDAALIDSLVKGIRSGGITWFARIDLDRDHVSEAWAIITVDDDGDTQELLHSIAETSVLFQSVKLRAGTTAVDVTLPTGPAVRLDWSYDLRHADGTSEIGNVRSYWLLDGSKTIVAQLTTYGDHPAVVGNFDAVVQTFRWGS